MSGPMNARIVYWGIAGAGKSTNLETIHAKLRSSNRGDLRRAMTRIDPTVTYEVLPIQLGEVGGVPIEIEIVTVPDGAEQAPTRKQLLDEVNGIVLVIDTSPARGDENLAGCDELREALASYGRSLADLPLVVQYNKRDLVDDNVIEALHRRLALPSSAVFEAVAIDGTGVLPTLTTVSKAVVKRLRDAASATAATAAATAAPSPVAATTAATAGEPPVAAPPPGPIATPPAAATPPEAPMAPDANGTASPIYDPDAMAGRVAGLADPTDRADRADSAGGSESELATRERTTPADASARLLESALEAEALTSSDVLDADEMLEQQAQTHFDASFEQLASEDKPRQGLSLGDDLRIVSVGTATRADERSVRIPLVLGDASGTTASLALTISLDGLTSEEDA